VQVVEGLNAARSAFRRNKITALDPFRFASGDDSRPEHLPHCWDATSDSVAARVAHVAEAERLILLKSATIPPGLSWEDCGKQGFVDRLFAATIAGGKFAVEWVNLREWGGAK
jgi:5-(aminomethyl)-3-furanmethanol phosphate kinase